MQNCERVNSYGLTKPFCDDCVSAGTVTSGTEYVSSVPNPDPEIPNIADPSSPEPAKSSSSVISERIFSGQPKRELN